MSPYILGIAAIVALTISTIADKSKSIKALKIAGKRLLALLPSFLTMLAAVSIVLTLVPEQTIARYLGNEHLGLATILGALFGSVSLMPGFIAFPLAGILVKRGVAYMVLSAFTTTLMMVGIVTYPIEKRYFGAKVTIIRNLLSMLTACIVAVITGLYFGELV